MKKDNMKGIEESDTNCYSLLVTTSKDVITMMTIEAHLPKSQQS